MHGHLTCFVSLLGVVKSAKTSMLTSRLRISCTQSHCHMDAEANAPYIETLMSTCKFEGYRYQLRVPDAAWVKGHGRME